jgi:hypothetical protein
MKRNFLLAFGCAAALLTAAPAAWARQGPHRGPTFHRGHPAVRYERPVRVFTPVRPRFYRRYEPVRVYPEVRIRRSAEPYVDYGPDWYFSFGAVF